MFDIGFSELLLIAVVALVVIGPERLPGVARNIGKFIGRLQRYANDIKRDFNREIEFEEIRRLQHDMESTVQSMQASVRAVEASLAQEVRPREEVLATTLEEAQQKLDQLRAEVERLGGTAQPVTLRQAQEPGIRNQESGIGHPQADEATRSGNIVPSNKIQVGQLAAQTSATGPDERQFDSSSGTDTNEDQYRLF